MSFFEMHDLQIKLRSSSRSQGDMFQDECWIGEVNTSVEILSLKFPAVEKNNWKNVNKFTLWKIDTRAVSEFAYSSKANKNVIFTSMEHDKSEKKIKNNKSRSPLWACPKCLHSINEEI